ncbi:MAG TPA: VanW family protein [Gaiellaceae bacterium]|nr:VanW family protein [Gaiellaceae bacterium]
MAATSSAIQARRRAAARKRFRVRVAWLSLFAVIAALGVGLLFAGSPHALAAGTHVDGVDVGGMSRAEARATLERRWEQVAREPMRFTWGSHVYSLTAAQLGIRVDWAKAVDEAASHGDGLGFVRGYRRLKLRFFPADASSTAHGSAAAVAYELGLMAKAIDTPHRNAQLVRHGLRFSVVPGETGRVLDRAAAGQLLVAALGSFERHSVVLPVRVDSPAVTAASLARVRRSATIAVSAPVTLTVGPTRLRLPRWRIATMLDLSQPGTLRLGGRAATAELSRLQKTVDRSPRDADWAVGAGGSVRVVPAQPGITLDVEKATDTILAAATRPVRRVAALPVSEQAPARTTAQATALGITGTVGAYETFFGGDANRIHNVQLVSHLVDKKLIAPGATFSFNQTTGERSAAKGFREAPVIINGELETGLGGGVCQVSTTVFNAAFESGLPITARTNHALYISHYPLGRDATVNYPDVDLKFVNDTGHWMLLRTWVSSSSLTVALYGTPQHRRVESEAQPLRVVAPPPVQKTDDPDLLVGQTVVDDPGAPSQSTSVERKVYSSSGKLLSDQTWSSFYRAEPKLVRVGTKKPPKPKKTATPPESTTATDTAPTAPR